VILKIMDQILTTGELEVADVFVEGKPAELHPFANHGHVTPAKIKTSMDNAFL
jgi:hypothetical protein